MFKEKGYPTSCNLIPYYKNNNINNNNNNINNNNYNNSEFTYTLLGENKILHPKKIQNNRIVEKEKENILVNQQGDLNKEINMSLSLYDLYDQTNTDISNNIDVSNNNLNTSIHIDNPPIPISKPEIIENIESLKSNSSNINETAPEIIKVTTPLSSRSSEYKPFAANKIKQFRELFNKIDENTIVPPIISSRSSEAFKQVKNIQSEILNVKKVEPENPIKSNYKVESPIFKNFKLESPQKAVSKLDTTLSSSLPESDRSFSDIHSSYSSFDNSISSNYYDVPITKKALKYDLKPKNDEIDNQVDDILSKWRKQKQTVELKDASISKPTEIADKVTEIIKKRSETADKWDFPRRTNEIIEKYQNVTTSTTAVVKPTASSLPPPIYAPLIVEPLTSSPIIQTPTVKAVVKAETSNIERPANPPIKISASTQVSESIVNISPKVLSSKKITTETQTDKIFKSVATGTDSLGVAADVRANFTSTDYLTPSNIPFNLSSNGLAFNLPFIPYSVEFIRLSDKEIIATTNPISNISSTNSQLKTDSLSFPKENTSSNISAVLADGKIESSLITNTRDNTNISLNPFPTKYSSPTTADLIKEIKSKSPEVFVKTIETDVQNVISPEVVLKPTVGDINITSTSEISSKETEEKEKIKAEVLNMLKEAKSNRSYTIIDKPVEPKISDSYTLKLLERMPGLKGDPMLNDFAKQLSLIRNKPVVK